MCVCVCVCVCPDRLTLAYPVLQFNNFRFFNFRFRLFFFQILNWDSYIMGFGILKQCTCNLYFLYLSLSHPTVVNLYHNRAQKFSFKLL